MEGSNSDVCAGFRRISSLAESGDANRLTATKASRTALSMTIVCGASRESVGAARPRKHQNEMKLFPLVLMTVAALGVALPAMSDASGSTAEQAAPQVPSAGSYRIQPGDLLSISVWKEADLQLEVLVRPDGGLSFPLAGDQVAEGRTVDELRKSLAEQLKKFIPDPVVTVAVRALGGNRIYVIGKVNRPGEFPFSRPLDVMQSLSLAGGATSFADTNDIRIIRRDESGKQVVIGFRYDEVARGRHMEQNVLLRSGDTVVVP
jgi:polysaccharide biosynthesis/export protein